MEPDKSLKSLDTLDVPTSALRLVVVTNQTNPRQIRTAAVDIRRKVEEMLAVDLKLQTEQPQGTWSASFGFGRVSALKSVLALFSLEETP